MAQDDFTQVPLPKITLTIFFNNQGKPRQFYPKLLSYCNFNMVFVQSGSFIRVKLLWVKPPWVKLSWVELHKVKVLIVSNDRKTLIFIPVYCCYFGQTQKPGTN